MSQPLASFQVSWGFHDLFSAVFHSIPKILVFLFILVIGWFVATASIVLVALGVVAALSQAGVGAADTQPILYTILLTSGGIIAIGVGGGLVKPMQARWERLLAAAEGQPGSQPGASPPPPAGPRYLQSPVFARSPAHLQKAGVSPSHGCHQGPGSRVTALASPLAPGYYGAAGQPAGDDIQDDPENYPGGQYM